MNRNHLDNSYRRIVDFRNQIVHGYFGIDHDIVWQVINDKLDNLNNDLIDFVKSNEIDLTEAIEAAMEENEYHESIVSFLRNLSNDI